METPLGEAMKLTPTAVDGAYIIEPVEFGDARGMFSPIYEDRKFANLNLCSHFTRVNGSFSAQKGTLRGLHYQPAPYKEAKLLRVIRGRVWDIAVDIREDSPSFGKWAATELSAENRKLFYIPPGCAHGFQTLEENTEVLYLCSNYYTAEHEKGICWNDPFFSIDWPLPPTVLSDKDQNHPSFAPPSP